MTVREHLRVGSEIDVAVNAHWGLLMAEGWFAGQGWSAAATGLLMFAISGAILVWLRVSSSRKFDPPVNHEGVRWAAIVLATMGTAWLVGAVVGLGGVIVVGAVALTLTLGFWLRTRART
jgi:hypothetical protein